MFGTFVKYQFQRTYDAILAALDDTEELVSAEAIWIATRAGVYGCVPMIVAMFFGLDPAWGMLAVPVIAWIAGFGWANFGIAVAGFSKSFENFNYVVSAVLTPLFLLAGSFFPLDGFPEWLQVLAQLNPLYHLVQLLRDAVLYGWAGWVDVAHLGFLVGFGIRCGALRSSDDAQARRLSAEVISRCALNRALLARQHLLRTPTCRSTRRATRRAPGAGDHAAVHRALVAARGLRPERARAAARGAGGRPALADARDDPSRHRR
jgi:hypothetical protein